MNSHRHFVRLVVPLALAGVAVLATACSSSGPSPANSSSPPPATSAPPTSPATSASPTGSTSGAGTAAVAANWEAFFNAKTPTSQRVALLQDGSQFESVIKAQAGTGLASAATAKVTHVAITSPTMATVTYDILVGGTPALKNQTGVAVNENGTWKVGVTSFCGLLTLENSGKTNGLPPACKSAA